MIRRLLITGSRGLVGTALNRKSYLLKHDYDEILTPTRSTLDLRDRELVFKYFKDYKPSTVVNCAATVGGIIANQQNPTLYGSDNLLIQTNVIDASHTYGVEKFIFLGSSCIYPKVNKYPLVETELFSGILDTSNLSFATAKLSGIALLEAYVKEYGLDKWITAIPTSIYGLDDIFFSSKNHVIPALISKIEHAKQMQNLEIPMVGDGSPLREFLFSDDLADALILLILSNNLRFRRYNIGSGYEISIKELAEKIAIQVGYTGKLAWGDSTQNGVSRKLIDSSRIFELGFKPKVSLEQGLKKVIDYFIKHTASILK